MKSRSKRDPDAPELDEELAVLEDTQEELEAREDYEGPDRRQNRIQRAVVDAILADAEAGDYAPEGDD